MPIRVFLVDDHEVVRRGLVSLLAGPEVTIVGQASGGDEAVKLTKKTKPSVVLLDVREPEETVHGVIPGARQIPLGQLEARWAELKNCDEIVCYCAHGMRSIAAAEILRQHGLFNATSLEGGVAAWQALGGKLVPR